MRLAGRTAIVTGGASGIGLSFAERFVAEGAKVVIADVRGAAAAAESLGDKDTCIGIEADVASEDSVGRMIEATLENFGQLDILINNAAISSTLKPTPFEMTSLDDWERIFRINTFGTFLCCRAAAGPMRDAGRGRIINITSGTAFKGTPLMMPYVASKGAIISMTRALANELGGHNILVNAIAPGFTATDAMKRNTEFYSAAKDTAVATRALRREARSEDLVGAAVFLASDDSAFITGQILAVDGGSVYH
ncbi:glucose 1-dehydrogenase [Aquibium sp. LZ166]|uniref:Glucose 1-dehydrogenase n=1 Tax=Aquibium pacificus TaxID=3153579 RepID=A0ABV3SCC2_9HYPH